MIDYDKRIEWLNKINWTLATAGIIMLMVIFIRWNPLNANL